MPGCGRPIPVSDVFWTSTTIFNLGANQLLACLFAARIKCFFRSIVYKNYFTISLKYRRHLKCKLSWKPSWDPEKTTCSINLLCFTPILHGCFHDLGSWSNIFFDWNNTANVWQKWMFVSTPFLVAPGVGETVVFSGHSSIVESSSSHAMILLQQQLMKFKQPGHGSRPRG